MDVLTNVFYTGDSVLQVYFAVRMQCACAVRYSSEATLRRALWSETHPPSFLHTLDGGTRGVHTAVVPCVQPQVRECAADAQGAICDGGLAVLHARVAPVAPTHPPPKGRASQSHRCVWLRA